MACRYSCILSPNVFFDRIKEPIKPFLLVQSYHTIRFELLQGVVVVDLAGKLHIKILLDVQQQLPLLSFVVLFVLSYTETQTWLSLPEEKKSQLPTKSALMITGRFSGTPRAFPLVIYFMLLEKQTNNS